MDYARTQELISLVDFAIAHINRANCDECLESMAATTMEIAKEFNATPINKLSVGHGLFEDIVPGHVQHIIDRLNASSGQTSEAAVVDSSLRYLQQALRISKL